MPNTRVRQHPSHLKPRKALDAIAINRSFLDRFLHLYHPEQRLVEDATLTGTTMSALLRPTVYPFTVADLDYVTATQIALFASQLSYVFLASVIEHRTHPPASHVSLEFFECEMDAGRLFFLDLNQRMRRHIPKTSLISANISLHRTKIHCGAMFTFMTFTIHHGACEGALTASMGLPQ